MCDAAIEAERLAWVARQRDEATDAALRRSGLPKPYATRERTLHDVTDAASLRLARGVMRGEVRGMYLYGIAGADKTSVAAAALAEWIADVEQPRNGMYVSVADLMSDIQATYGGDARLTRNDLVRPLIETPALLLDDLGKEKPSDHAAGVIYQILDGRYRQMAEGAKRVLFITSNYSLDKLCSRFQDDEVALPIRRRIEEMTVALEMKL